MVFDALNGCVTRGSSLFYRRHRVIRRLVRGSAHGRLICDGRPLFGFLVGALRETRTQPVNLDCHGNVT